MNQTQVQSLISLLDDEDEEVYLHVSEKIRAIGKAVKPQLENAWFGTTDGLLKNRIQDLIVQINNKNALELISDWLSGSKENILDLLIGFASHKYDMDELQLRTYIGEIRMEAWMNMSYNINHAQQVKLLSSVMFEQFGLNKAGKIQLEHYFSVDINYVGNLLLHRTASSALMCLLYLHLSQQLEIPLRGVRLKNHLILACVNHKNEILFYVNPFNRGIILTRNDISMFIERSNFSQDEKYYSPCSNAEIVKSYFEFVMQCYNKENDAENVQFMEEILSLFEQHEIFS